jgi:hypothetical protein
MFLLISERAGPDPYAARILRFYGANRGGQLGSVMLVPVTNNLICDPRLALVPVVVLQRPVDKRRQKYKRTDEIHDFLPSPRHAP